MPPEYELAESLNVTVPVPILYTLFAQLPDAQAAPIPSAIRPAMVRVPLSPPNSTAPVSSTVAVCFQ